MIILHRLLLVGTRRRFPERRGVGVEERRNETTFSGAGTGAEKRRNEIKFSRSGSSREEEERDEILRSRVGAE